MSRKNKVFLTASQIALGGSIGLVVGWFCLFIVETLIWKGLIGNNVQHGFWAGLFLLISFGVTYGGSVAGVAEGVRFVGRWFGVDIVRKDTYQGAFLGAPAIVALMSLLDIHWEGLIAPNLLVSLIFIAAQILAYLASLPIRLLLWMRCPPELLFVIAAPIGAILGYRLDWKHTRTTDGLT